MEGRIGGTIAMLENEKIGDYPSNEVRNALLFLNRNAASLNDAQVKSCIEISIRVIEARQYSFSISEALDLLSKLTERALPAGEQLERFIQADLLNDSRDCVWQFSRSRAIGVFEALIKNAKDPAYAETAAVALAEQSMRVSVKRDMAPLALLMEGAAAKVKTPDAKANLAVSLSLLKRKLGH